jgi:hypothetical protein
MVSDADAIALKSIPRIDGVNGCRFRCARGRLQMLYIVKIAALSAALSAGFVTAYGHRHEPATGAKAFYDRLPAHGNEAGLLRFVLPADPHAA